MGVHITRSELRLTPFLAATCWWVTYIFLINVRIVKSIDLDTWTSEQVATVQRWGNRRANAYWEAHLRPGHMPPDQLSNVYRPFFAHVHTHSVTTQYDLLIFFELVLPVVYTKYSKIESFIRSKYESKRWVMDGPMPEPETLDEEGGVDTQV